MLEAQTAIRQAAKSIVEKLVDGTGIYNPPEAPGILDILVIRAERQLDVRMVQDRSEHRRVAVLRHRLEFIGEVAVIAVGPRRHAGSNGLVQLRGVETPLFARVSTEEFLVELS